MIEKERSLLWLWKECIVFRIRYMGEKKNRNRIRRVYGKYQLPPDAKVGDIIKTKRGYKQITGIYENGRFRMKNLEKKHTGKRKTKEKKRYNQKTRGKER